MSLVFWGSAIRSKVVDNARRKIERIFCVSLEIEVCGKSDSDATYRLTGDRIDRNRAKSYIQALAREGEFVEKTVYPRDCDLEALERIEAQTGCVLEHGQGDAFSLRGPRLYLTVAITLLEEIATRNEPQTPKSKAASRRLSTALEQTLTKTNHKCGYYGKASDAVKRAIASCIIISEDQDEKTEYILIDDDSEEENIKEWVCLDETVLEDDFAGDNIDDDVIIIETPRVPVSKTSLFFSEDDSESPDIDQGVEVVTNELKRMRTPSYGNPKATNARPSAAVRPLIFSECASVSSKETAKFGEGMSETERAIANTSSDFKPKNDHLDGHKKGADKVRHETSKRKLSVDSSAAVEIMTHRDHMQRTKKRNKRRRIRSSVSVASDSGIVERESAEADPGKKKSKKTKKNKKKRKPKPAMDKDNAEDPSDISKEKGLLRSRRDLKPESCEEQPPLIVAKRSLNEKENISQTVRLSRWDLTPNSYAEQKINFEMKLENFKFGSQTTDNRASIVTKKSPIIISVRNDSRSVSLDRSERPDRFSQKAINLKDQVESRVERLRTIHSATSKDSLAGGSHEGNIEPEVQFISRLLPTKDPLVTGSQDSLNGNSNQLHEEPKAPAATLLLPPQPPPAAASKGSSLRYIVIDGSNVAMCHSGNSDVFSCRGIRLCVEFFKRRGHRLITVFLPHWRKCRPVGSASVTHRYELDALEKEGLLVYTPSRKIGNKLVACYDDRFIVELAEREEGVIVSNDQYRDLQKEKRSWRKVIEERLLMYAFVRDQFMVPEDPLGRTGPTLEAFLRRAPPRPLPQNRGNSYACPAHLYKDATKNPHLHLK
ncbi:uncharacterized protein LOC127856923 isoform X2 [Dreissena polymorpha]|nr:uncharacterized protein LOC127856923 isoform X2 [Dreissena polymorpha]